MELYPDKVAKGAAAHSIWAFDTDNSAKPKQYLNNITTKLYATGSNDTVSISLSAGGAPKMRFNKRTEWIPIPENDKA